jgi:hypothetical protein
VLLLWGSAQINYRALVFLSSRYWGFDSARR